MGGLVCGLWGGDGGVSSGLYTYLLQGFPKPYYLKIEFFLQAADEQYRYLNYSI